MARNFARLTLLTIRESMPDVRLTANARTLATRQAQQVQSHLHTSLAVGVGEGSLGLGQSSYALYGSGTTGLSGGPETRPMNIAYHPRIHV